jgi:hypothetical protein
MNWPKSAILIITAAVAVVVLAFAFRGLRRSVSTSPERPKSVPQGAVWVGAEKGEWILCVRSGPGSDIVNCKLFNHPRGQQMSEGSYLWKNAIRGATLPALVSFDGEVIATSAGDFVPVGKHTYWVSDTETYEKDYGPGTK